jgi:hypothetical protein
LPSGPSLIISYFSTNLERTTGVRERDKRLLPGTAETARRTGGQLGVGHSPPVARAARGRLRQQSPGLQLGINRVCPILLLLLLVHLYQLLLLLEVLIRVRQLLMLVLLGPNLLLLLSWTVIFQLENKVNNYFSQQVTQISGPRSATPPSVPENLTST